MPPPARERCESLPTCGEGINKVRLAEVASGQWGLVTRSQLSALGVGHTLRNRWVREGRLHRIHVGVYAVGHTHLGLEGRLAAALFCAGPGAALYGLTAGSWLGLLEAAPKVLHVCTGRQVRSPEGVRVHCRRLVRRIWHNGLPTTPPAQVLLDMAGGVPGEMTFKQLRRALAEAEHRRLVTLEEVEATLGRGKPGSAKLRKALDTHRPELAQTKSWLEEALVHLCEEFGLEQPKMNVSLAGWLVDAVWWDDQLVVELDSRIAHSTSYTQERDHQRDLDLRAAGFRVRRYTWQQLRHRPEQVAGDLRRSLRQRTLLIPS